MEYKGIKINIVLLVAIIMIIGFFGGKYLLVEYNVREPLLNSILQRPGVIDAELEENNSGTSILVQFDSGIDLKNEYQDLREMIDNNLNQTAELIIVNEEDEKLQVVFNKVHYALYEGLVTGQYMKMQKDVDSILSEYNYEYQLTVDHNNIYFKVKNEQNSLYKIISIEEKGRG